VESVEKEDEEIVYTRRVHREIRKVWEEEVDGADTIFLLLLKLVFEYYYNEMFCFIFGEISKKSIKISIRKNKIRKQR